MSALSASDARSVRLEGQGLHGGRFGAVRFSRLEGPIVFDTGTTLVSRRDLSVVDTLRSTTIGSTDGSWRLATVEHMFAALAGLAIQDGVAVSCEGPELPLLDGGARAFAEALLSLDIPHRRPLLRVARSGVVVVGDSTFHFDEEPAALSPTGASVEVEVSFEDEGLATVARFDGNPRDFVARIAPARTFGFEHEVQMLAERGLASHVSPESVVVLGRSRILSAGAPFTADEPARHKLLDLLGDLFFYGGPPRGHVRAVRPGHAATHRAMHEALARGLVAHDDP